MTTAAVTLDVRAIAPRFRHSLIFAIFDHLPPGQALVLTNDHDPRPLYQQFATESDGHFSWDYLQQGPGIWQVRIGREEVADARAQEAGCCGGGCGGY